MISNTSNHQIFEIKMNPFLKKFPGFISLIPSFPYFRFQTINALHSKLPLQSDFQLTAFSKTATHSLKEEEILLRNIKSDTFLLHFVKGTIHSFKIINKLTLFR